MPNDVYFKVGLITIIGLSAKNAILIIEFAKDLQAQGKSLIEATLEAAHLRFRPILMTSLAFILGVLPLVVATRRRLGQPARDRHRRDGRHDHRRPCWRCSSCRCSSSSCARIFKGSERQRKLYAHADRPRSRRRRR